MCFYLYIIIFILTHFINESKTETWVNPNDLTPNYPNEWIDPHDMGPSKEYLKYTNNPSTLHKRKHLTQSNLPSPSTSDQLIEIYYKRMINMLLNSVHEDNNEIDMYSGYLYFKINYNNYERLKNFAENNENENDLFEVNKILEEILTKPSHQHIQEFLESWFHKFLNITFSRKGIITIILLSYIFVVYKMITDKYHLRYIFTFFCINIFIYDFIFTWIHLYQEAEIQLMVNRMKYDTIPVECDPKTMNSWQFLWKAIRVEDECEKYHQVMYQDIFWKISPGAVLTDMFARIIEKPASAIGNAFGNICASIYVKLPWPMNLIIFPFAMIFFCLIIMILLSIIFNRNLHFNFLHLLSFSNSAAIDTTKTNRGGDRLTNKNIKRLLRITEQQQKRVFIEEIKTKPTQKPDTTVMKTIKNTDETEVKEDKKVTSTTEEDQSKNLHKRKKNIGAGDS